MQHVSYRQNLTNTLDQNPISHGQLKTRLFSFNQNEFWIYFVKRLSIEPFFSLTLMLLKINLISSINRMDTEHALLLEHSFYRLLRQNLPSKE